MYFNGLVPISKEVGSRSNYTVTRKPVSPSFGVVASGQFEVFATCDPFAPGHFLDAVAFLRSCACRCAAMDSVQFRSLHRDNRCLGQTGLRSTSAFRALAL